MWRFQGVHLNESRRTIGTEVNGQMSTLIVVEKILREAATPLSVKDIVARAGAELPTKSKTPDTVVARDLSMDIKRKGEGSLFVRTSPGRYAMREMQATTSITEKAVSESRAPTKAAPLTGDVRDLDQSDSASA